MIDRTALASRREWLASAGTGFGALALNAMLAGEVPAAPAPNPLAPRKPHFKPTAKATVRTGGVLTPDSVTLPKAYFSQLGAQEVLGIVSTHLGLPVVVKPNQGGSGLGVSWPPANHGNERPRCL